jgi:hypothetical protein
MNYISLKIPQDEHEINLKLEVSDLKILHNACVDILREYPEMIGYQRVQNKLNEIIKSNHNETNQTKKTRKKDF